ncbi:MAG: ribosomal protein S18-alanine N-acetyltransferase [Phycisphaerae bacterium]|nr:ribosomal protein S18-alanine N-acetyltransferase [Gemmatimonadaceae bacterium]
MSDARVSEAYSIREARRSDVPLLAAIEVESFSDPWPRSAFTDALNMPSSRLTVAVDKLDMPAAYCMLITAADQGEIANIAVSRKAQRRGLAGRLLDDALQFATQAAVVAVFLEVRESNEAARALYRSRRFQEIGRRKGYYQRPTEDALVLQWTGATGAILMT